MLPFRFYRNIYEWTCTWTLKLFIWQEKIQTCHNITKSTWQYVFVVGRPLQRRWAHRLRKGHPRVLQCINRHCTMRCQTFGSVGKLNTHTHFMGESAIFTFAGHTIDNENGGLRNKNSCVRYNLIARQLHVKYIFKGSLSQTSLIRMG